MKKPKRNKPEVGQIWQDWDVRFRNSHNPRFVTIKSIDKYGMYATCKSFPSGKITLIRIDRFKPNSTGYKLVKKCKQK